MALNKERKVLLGLLGSAGLILAADQFLLGPPSGAEASESPMQESAAPADPVPPIDDGASVSGDAAGLSSQAAQRWNEQLAQSVGEADPEGVTDPFARREVVSAPVVDVSDQIAAAEFVGTHHLTLVLISQDSVAMVDGKPVRIGEEVAGYRLVSVDPRSATFQLGDQTARLTLPRHSMKDP